MEFEESAGEQEFLPPRDMYNVQLDAFKGPLDLLLYLIRRAEVDIYDIPIAEITTQYLAYLDLMREVNITVAGEFVLMAATLMEIKSKMILPREELDDYDDEEEGDPRSELVRQLLEYKRFKDAARMLEQAEEQQSLKYPRPPFDREALGLGTPETDDDIFESVSLWDLLTAFSKVLKETSLRQPRTIYATDKPLKYFMLIVLEALREQGRVLFTDLFVDISDRAEVIGVFLAILELCRLRRVKVEQVRPFGEIYLALGEEDSDAELPDDVDSAYASSADDSSGNDEAVGIEPPSDAPVQPPGEAAGEAAPDAQLSPEPDGPAVDTADQAPAEMQPPAQTGAAGDSPSAAQDDAEPHDAAQPT